MFKIGSYAARSTPPLVKTGMPIRYSGLSNLGFTCYANSILQAIYTSNQTRRHVMAHPEFGSLHAILSDLFKRMWKFPPIKQPDGRYQFSCQQPVTFINEFRKLRPEFRSGQEHDAHEFLFFLIDKLHQETNEATNRTKPATHNDIGPDDAWEYHVTYIDDSPYARIYMGQMEMSLICIACGHKSRHWECFWQLQLEVPNDTSMDVPHDGQAKSSKDQPQVTVKSCIGKLMSEEISGDSDLTCAKCKQNQGFKQWQTVCRAPTYLIVSLKRFTPTAKITREVPFETHLSLANRNYVLSSCVMHSGTIDNGHYMTLYSENDTSWTLFDDGLIYIHVPSEDVHEKISKWGYIGFYRAIN